MTYVLSLGAVGGAGGLVLLFHGASGVGKTMMANAVAKHVGRKVLLINFPSLGSNEAGATIRFIFRCVNVLPRSALPLPNSFRDLACASFQHDVSSTGFNSLGSR